MIDSDEDHEWILISLGERMWGNICTVYLYRIFAKYFQSITSQISFNCKGEKYVPYNRDLAVSTLPKRIKLVSLLIELDVTCLLIWCSLKYTALTVNILAMYIESDTNQTFRCVFHFREI